MGALPAFRVDDEDAPAPLRTDAERDETPLDTSLAGRLSALIGGLAVTAGLGGGLVWLWQSNWELLLSRTP